MPRKKPIDRRFLLRFASPFLDRGVVTAVAIDEWAARYIDGRSRKEREKAIAGPWFEFLTAKLRASLARVMTMHAARHPSEN